MFAHAVKVYRGRRDIAQLILNLGTRWEWSFDASTAYPRGKYLRFL
jgi:hypothetical protein